MVKKKQTEADKKSKRAKVATKMRQLLRKSKSVGVTTSEGKAFRQAAASLARRYKIALASVSNEIEDQDGVLVQVFEVPDEGPWRFALACQVKKFTHTAVLRPHKTPTKWRLVGMPLDLSRWLDLYRRVEAELDLESRRRFQDADDRQAWLSGAAFGFGERLQELAQDQEFDLNQRVNANLLGREVEVGTSLVLCTREAAVRNKVDHLTQDRYHVVVENESGASEAGYRFGYKRGVHRGSIGNSPPEKA